MQWFHSYLTGREQRVVMSSEITGWIDVARGFPQGSGLSPLLFNIYVRKLPAVTSVRTFQFADDITNSDAQKNLKVLEQHLLHSYHQTKNFCDEHHLVINPSKSQLIVFQAQGKRLPSDFALEVSGCKITPAHSVKLLGVTLDQYLTFGEHTDNVVKKCHGLIGVLAKAAPYLTRQLLRLAYVSLIRSQLEYCSAIFASAAPSQLRKLDTSSENISSNNMWSAT